MDYEQARYYKRILQKQPDAIICGESISGERFRVAAISAHLQGDYEIKIKRSDGITAMPDNTKFLIQFDTLQEGFKYLNYGDK